MNDTLNSSVDWPDHPWWHDEIDYNPDVARRLNQAYAHLHRAGRAQTQEDVYLSVFAWVRSCRGRSMSHRQLMRVHYLMGMVLVKRDGDYSSGFDHFVTASDLAAQIGDRGSVVELANLAGSAARAMLNCVDASECHSHSLQVLRSLPQAPTSGSVAPSREVDILLALAGDKFLLGQYAWAQHYLDEASFLLPGISNSGLQAATVDWINALLLRWQGRAELALNAALRASNAYSRLATSPAARLAFDRQSAVVADIALDLAESRLAEGYRRDGDQYVALAYPFVAKATQLADEVQDRPGWALAELTHIRYERVAGFAADGRIAAIEGVVKSGRQLQDVAILGQAQTALGHELAALGRKEQAGTRYRKALDVFSNSETPAMGIWAQRALLRQSEMME